MPPSAAERPLAVHTSRPGSVSPTMMVATSIARCFSVLDRDQGKAGSGCVRMERSISMPAAVARSSSPWITAKPPAINSAARSTLKFRTLPRIRSAEVTQKPTRNRGTRPLRRSFAGGWGSLAIVGSLPSGSLRQKSAGVAFGTAPYRTGPSRRGLPDEDLGLRLADGDAGLALLDCDLRSCGIGGLLGGICRLAC